ncbi:hypothetical protein FK220_005505 [Flavobacteriaceae bacterium TP-CH-4]|uniref:Outer membrane protein beta-barrel domain-containing protein n=1 Tax=Pelagihabitans pacificus TaxID=2696054 RepID=A0A967E9T8_9FLAO|nr:hypothetical protein [Pelagihabitans pacificus]NHF58786.1 hypothetical protein [Pelagihabitans pacificus]
MKKYLIFVGFLSASSLAMAQAYQQYGTDHELKFNMGQFLVNSTVEGSYEYYFTEDTSIGGTVYFNGDATGRNGNFGIGPNLRAYFGYRPKSGFFAEAFGLYFTGQDDIDEDTLGRRNTDYGATAIGLGFGRKWATFNQKLTFELYGGLGRTITDRDEVDAFLFRGGLSIGFRF